MNGPIGSPNIVDVIPQQWAAIVEAMERLAPSDPYLPWEEIRRQPQPEGISHEAWWSALKMARASRLQAVPLHDRRGNPFKFNMPHEVLATLHELDRQGGSAPVGPRGVERLAASARLEEAISSAQLAGADTGYDVAKEMLRTGRAPRGRSERMVANHDRALQRAAEFRDRALSSEILLGLHQCLTEGALDDAGAVGRFRSQGEGAPVLEEDGMIRPEPPPARELPERMEAMCAFANGQTPAYFIHPAIRAMILHFWLAHDRPFLGGNGRAARVLFLWAMLRQGYRLAEFVSISSVLRRAPARYARAFLLVETDENDLTYFLLHQAEVLRTAEADLRRDVRRSTQEVAEAEQRLRGFAELNPRQQVLIAHALRKPETRYRIANHQHSHGVTHQTARDDLFDLAQRELLTVGREGRVYVFCAPGDLTQRLRAEAKHRRQRKEAGEADELPTALR